MHITFFNFNSIPIIQFKKKKNGVCVLLITVEQTSKTFYLYIVIFKEVKYTALFTTPEGQFLLEPND